jgi:hypothetical protein
MPTPNSSIRISVVLDIDTDRAARVEAARQGVSKSEMIAALVREKLKVKKEK